MSSFIPNVCNDPLCGHPLQSFLGNNCIKAKVITKNYGSNNLQTPIENDHLKLTDSLCLAIVQHYNNFKLLLLSFIQV